MMKKTVIPALLVLAVVSSLVSCKKDSASTHDRLVARWNVSSVVYHMVTTSSTQNLTETPPDGAYIEFKADSSCFVNVALEGVDPGSQRWFADGNTLSVVHDGDTTAYDIKKLDGSSLTLYSKQGDESDYTETTIQAKK